MDKTYVDLHLHTEISRKIGDSISWISLKNTLYQIRNSGIKVFAFTDHDQFSYNQYIQAKQLIEDSKMDLNIYPGVEMTIIRKNGQRGHILFIFNNNLANKGLQDLELIINSIRIKSSYGAILTKIIQKLNAFDFFIIPHVDKSDSISYEDVEEVKEYVFNVESEKDAPELKSFSKKSNSININPIKFSDWHTWKMVFPKPRVFINEKITFDNLKYKMRMEN